MKRIIAVLAVLSMVCIEGRAQFASLGGENGNIRWETLTSNNYKVLFPVGLDSLGMRYSTLLEQYRPLVGNSVGLYPNQFYRTPMPVVLHADAAISNGAVVWAPRRMDIFTFPDAYGSLPPVPWEKILAIHENRHIAQNQFTRAGYKKYYYWPFGEIGLTLAGTLFENAALFEGDAVVAETALTNSGRGRSADFLSFIRMSFAEGDMRDWYRWRYGSQKWYTPDYYKIGYMTVAGMRYNYDATMFMADYLRNLSDPFAFNAVRKSMQKYSGKSIKGTWNEIAATFKDIWAQDDSLRAPFQEIIPLVPASKYFTSYRGAVQTRDGRVFALRAAMDRQQELVEILPDGSVRAIRPMNADSKLVYSPYTNCIYWTESVPDRRWELVQTSRIRYVEAGGKEVFNLTKQWRYVNPAVSDDGTMMAAAEYPDKGGSRIVLLNIINGEEVKTINAPAGLQVTELAFMGNDKVAFTGISDGGMGLYHTDFSSIGTYEEAVPVKIKNLISKAGTLYFTCDRTGTNEIYSYTPGNLTQLTNTQHGVSSPFFRDGALSFSALTPDGSLLASVDAPLSRPVSLSDYASYPIADLLTAQENEFAKLPADTLVPVKSKYSRTANMFHIHSWLPLYYNWGSEYPSQSDYTFQTISPGATAFFQNLEGNAYGTLGVSVHADPFDQSKIAAGLHARLNYTGAYPVLNMSVDIGDRQKAKLSQALVSSNDSTFLSVVPNGGLFFGGSVGVSVPLNLSSGGWETTVVPSLTTKFSNDELGQGISYFRKSSTNGKLYQMGTGIKHFMNITFVASVTADTRRSMGPSQVVPRFGAGGELRYVKSPFEEGIGSGIYVNAYTYLPGLSSVQGLKLTASLQTRTQELRTTSSVSGFYSNRLMPMDTWGLGFENMAPRGFEETGTGATMLIVSPVSSLVGLDYVIPMFHFDSALTPYIYLSNLELRPYADIAVYVPDDTEYLYSAGADLIFRLEKLFMVSNTLKLGLRFAYNGGSQLYDDLGLKSPIYVGFIANTDL